MADDEEERRRAMEERWAKEWGPHIPTNRRRLMGAAMILAFLGLLALVIVTATR